MIKPALKWTFIVAFLWFLPWVPVLYLGFVLYFPYEANGKDRFLRIAGPLTPSWVSTKGIPKVCKRALIAAEDANFYEHYGVDPEGIEMAMRKNAKQGKTKWGGSTLTQQLVKNVFLSRERSYFRKAREVTGALLLNLIMSKDLQMTWYFNVVEFGPRIYGLQAAAHHYFRKKPEKLKGSECIRLVSILPDPLRSHRYMKNPPERSRVRERQQRLKRIVGN